MPSECFPGGLEEIACDWTIWQFDNAVLYFRGVIENALAERVETGQESQPKYTLSQLLAADFRLPRPPAPKEARRMVGEQVKAMFGMGRGPKGKGKGQGQPSPLMQRWLARGRTL